MARKLGKVQRKAVETFLGLLKVLPYNKVPKEVIEELAKNGLVKEENETMAQFSDRIMKHIKEVEQTI